MYADPDARGGILEAEGIVEIKFRSKDLVKAMHRMDDTLIELRAQLLAAADGKPEAKAAIEKKIKERELLLQPIYHQVAVHFADLHDTPERMQEKGVIQDIVPWKRARTTLYWRLRRLILEDRVESQIKDVRSGLTHGQVGAMLRRWYIEDKGASEGHLWEDNKTAVEWLSEQLDGPSDKTVVQENIKCFCRDAVLLQANTLLDAYPNLAVDSIVHLLQHMNSSQRAEAMRAISKVEAVEAEAIPKTEDNSSS